MEGHGVRSRERAAASGRADSVLVERCRGGDVRAFDELVLRHRDRALAVARRQMDDDQAAEDAVQQAFLYAYAYLSGLRDGARFGSWLAVIVSRLAKRYWRDRGRVEPHLLQGFPDDEQVLAELPAPGQDDAADQVRDQVHSILAVLTRQNREALELFYLHGLSYQEIATRLGEPLGTIKRRLHDSRRRFQREWRRMTTPATHARVGRRMRVWITGKIYNEALPLMSTLLPQTIALTIHKRARGAAQIAEKVGADRDYVEDVLSRMVHLELALKQRERYLLNFIALDCQDHAELLRHAQATGKELAKRLTPQIPKVQAAYQGTGLAARGWAWEQVQWIILPAFVYNAGVGRAAPQVVGSRRYQDVPLRPDGERWYLGGVELGDNSPPALPDCRMRALEGGGTGFVRWPGVERSVETHLREDSVGILRSLAEGGRTLKGILARAEGSAEDCRSALTRLLEQGLARRRGTRFELLFPVFQAQDTDLLLPVVDRVVSPAARDILVPRAREADAILKRLGHARLADQVSWMRGSLFSYDVRGWTLLHLSELGALPRPPLSPPASWGFFGWLGDGGGVFCTRG